MRLRGLWPALLGFVVTVATLLKDQEWSDRAVLVLVSLQVALLPHQPRNNHRTEGACASYLSGVHPGPPAACAVLTLVWQAP